MNGVIYLGSWLPPKYIKLIAVRTGPPGSPWRVVWHYRLFLHGRHPASVIGSTRGGSFNPVAPSTSRSRLIQYDRHERCGDSGNPTITIIWGGGGGPSKSRIIWHPGVDPPPKKYDALGRRDLRQIIMMPSNRSKFKGRPQDSGAPPSQNNMMPAKK